MLGHRPAVARVSIELTTSALWARRSEPTELSRHGWPPRNRTARYLRIRQAPSTSWVVASRWRRSRPPALARLPGSSRSRPPGRFAIRERRAEVLSPTASRRPPVFETEPAARQVHSPWRKTVDTIHRAFTPHRFPDGDHHLVVSSPSEESGRLERHGATRASVSNGARHPGRFTLHERRAGTAHRAVRTDPRGRAFPRLTTCPTRDSNSEPLPSEGSASTKLG
jgi:hypothetical protein